MSFSDDFPNAGFSRRPTSSTQYNGAPGGPPCPTCGSRRSAVMDSRPIESGGQRRRRKCLESEKCVRWNTYETNTDPRTINKPEISKLDRNRIERLIETTEALGKSLLK